MTQIQHWINHSDLEINLQPLKLIRMIYSLISGVITWTNDDQDLWCHVTLVNMLADVLVTHAYMDYMDLAVRYPRKAVKLNHSLTHLWLMPVELKVDLFLTAMFLHIYHNYTTLAH